MKNLAALCLGTIAILIMGQTIFAGNDVKVDAKRPRTKKGDFIDYDYKRSGNVGQDQIDNM